MEALMITEVGKAELKQIAEPEAGAGQVKIKVGYGGLCGSDLNTFKGLNPLAALPRIPGHEIGGTIVCSGADVPEEFAEGKSVIVVPYTECGDCTACRAGRKNACRYNKTLGVQQDGGLSNYMVAHHERLILNDTLSDVQLALVEPLSVGFHAIDRASVREGETVVVLGAGMIGVGAMVGAISRGARVIAVEVSEEKRETLLNLGVSEVLNPTKVDVAAEVDRLTDGDGANVTVEAVGLPITFRQAVDFACFAGRVVYVGYAKEEVSYETKFFNMKELNIFGSRNAIRQDFLDVIAYLEKAGDKTDALVSKVFKWKDAAQAFDYWDSVRSSTFKVLIDMTDTE
ncbi:zinc-binding alcohol dehydrogenase family protein [Polycladidibacter hongkongensis]|uniref:zinc-binding alcohol dehydrogenase family protein n=1 Tax=Polycladidibacter hongkongensis TaxID=1647556 RepID=UPI000830DC22|nr:zinc-binding alcohol dehydrogenase family protein [Pseudovibrio hongkongensis]